MRRRRRGFHGRTNSIVTIPARIVTGMYALTGNGQSTTSGFLSGLLTTTRGVSGVFVRPTWGGEWRKAPTVGCQTFTAADFGILNTSDPTNVGKLRVEFIAAMNQIHKTDLEAQLKLGVDYGSWAFGSPSTDFGPFSPVTNAVDNTITFASKSVDSNFGISPLPLADVPSGGVNVGVVSLRYMMTPHGVYDKTLTTGAAASRLMCWLEQDLTAINQFYNETCESAGSGYIAPWTTTHVRRTHFPLIQISAGIMEPSSNEDSRGYEATAVPSPTITDTSPIYLATDNGTDTITWTTSRTMSADSEWSPWCIASTAVNGLGCLIVWDDNDPANTYEIMPIDRVTSNAADHSSGTIRVLSGGRLAYGPQPLTNGVTYSRSTGQWTQSGNRVRMALFPWSSASDRDSKWAGLPGVSGAEVGADLKKINRSTFALTSLTCAMPLAAYNSTSMLMMAWYARDNHLTWKVCSRYGETGPTSLNIDSASKHNYPYPHDYTFTGNETEQQLETLCCKAYARHRLDILFMIASALGSQHVNVVYYGGIYNAAFGKRWTGSAATDITEAYVATMSTATPLPDNFFMARDTKRTNGGKEWPLPTRAATEYWSPTDAIFTVLAFPGLWNLAYSGWEERFAHGWTSVYSNYDGSSWSTPTQTDPAHIGAFAWLRSIAGSPAKLAWQFAGTAKMSNGDEVIHTCEDVYAHPTLAPIYLEGAWGPRYGNTSASIATGYLGWRAGSTNKQQSYLIGTSATNGADTSDRGYSIGDRMRSAAYQART